MKRHPSLQPLSREHHRALVCWRQLDQAIQHPTDSDLHAIFQELRNYWESRFETHLQQEESSLHPRLSASLQERMQRDHNTLRSMYESLASKASDDALSSNDSVLSNFATALREHIRWEERTVFPYLQEQLTEAELASLLYSAPNDAVASEANRCDTRGQ